MSNPDADFGGVICTPEMAAERLRVWEFTIPSDP